MTVVESMELRSPGRLAQFVAVGASGALVDTAVLIALVEFGSLDPVLGKVVSAEASIVFMFLVNETWTFSEFGQETALARVRRLVVSNLVRAVGLAVGIAVLAVLYRYAGVWYVAANAAGIGVGFVVNYVSESLFTWRVHEQ